MPWLLTIQQTIANCNRITAMWYSIECSKNNVVIHVPYNLNVLITFSWGISAKAFFCTEIISLPFKSKYSKLLRPTNAFLLIDLTLFQAKWNLINLLRLLNTPLASSIVQGILLLLS